jgi:two-component system, OmpR family, KDP operon response regulator KdpE
MLLNPLLLLVDDDPDILRSLSISLQADGYRTSSAKSGPQAIANLQAELPSLAIVDLMMPDMDGFETSRRIKRHADIPILILTAIDTGPTKVRAIELYADDYVTKPFDYAELVARVRRILSRTWPEGPPLSLVQIDDRLQLDFGARIAHVGDHARRLSPTENKLLHLLYANAGRTLPSELILDRIWPDGAGESGYLWEYIRRLRDKLDDDPESPRYILSERAIGYSFRLPKKQKPNQSSTHAS